MSEKLGPIAFGKDNDEVFIGRDYNHIRNYSEAVASEIDEEVERIILDAYKRTEAILTEHMDKLHVVAKALVEREKIDADEFYALMDGKELPPLKAKKKMRRKRMTKRKTANSRKTRQGRKLPQKILLKRRKNPKPPRKVKRQKRRTPKPPTNLPKALLKNKTKARR